jgi:serralysin
MSGSNAQGASVRYATANGTAAAGSDYVATSGTLTWAAGNTSAKTISVTVNGDRTVEPDETFYVNLTSATNATLAKSQGVGTIQNDDVLPALSIGDVTLTEGNSGRKTFTFTVSMSGSNAQGASVRYATANGTASAGSDYVATSGTLTWAAGNTSAKTISVTVNGDTTVEPDETFYVNLTSATNATLSKSQGVGTIQNDDGSPTISSMAIVTPAATNTLGNPSQDARTLSVAALSVNASTSPQGSPVSLTNQQIAPIVAEAERRLAVALGTQVAASLNGVSVQLADLPNGILGETSGKTILIDRDAAGYGWFVDATPSDDVEFAAHLGTETLATAKGSTAAQRVDLLTAVMHELGHVLGYRDDSSGDLMNATLPLGVRRIVAVDEVFASFS